MGEQERRFFHALCYAVGAEKALLQAVFRARIWRGKGNIPYPPKPRFYCVTNPKQRSYELGTGRTAWPDAPASVFPAQSPAPGWLSFSSCQSFDPLLSGRGDRGGTPLGAERRPLLGCPRQHKSYARYPTRQGCGLLVGGFFSADHGGVNNHLRVTPKVMSWSVVGG